MWRKISTFISLVLAVGGVTACGGGETTPTPAPEAAVPATTAAAVPDVQATPGGPPPWRLAGASEKCKLMGRYSEQLDKVAPVDIMDDPAEFKKSAPEFAELKKIAEEVAAAGMPEPLGHKFVQMNDAMLKLAEKGDLEAFQVAGFLDEEMGKAIDELGTWCN
ncbi:hypothetical protein [Buchananella hordeovulneris]|uniref:Uncharacterized protein n=1 Tax=Buchananella hordeovulneris TaxID=52770 RepID=A0A1Q5PTH6_9ACTO|nr:hypothetical protein [Buchananella hordeovulneris]OKL50779.1 hypothetical protein BSZ40_10845 [Buchananella hordeovulneris]